MEYIKALILGIIQGLTEFLPVSSSGHLEIGKFLMGNDGPVEESFLMTVVLHFGTACATIWYFREDILQIFKGLFDRSDTSSRKFAVNIVLSMIPAAIVGVFFEDVIDNFFNQNILLVCCMLLVTAALLFMADRAKNTTKSVGIMEALIIGVAQAIAILPGISRSGATISTATVLGIDRERAARFSFLMVVPLIFGKMAKDLLDGDFSTHSSGIGPLIVGFAAALITGYFACKWMIALVKRAKLSYFAYYCIVIGLIGIIAVMWK